MRTKPDSQILSVGDKIFPKADLPYLEQNENLGSVANVRQT
jgi:hypothetical protein